jgi:hypothetical protein
MDARTKAAAQLQALLAYKASGKGDRSIDNLIQTIQVRYGWVKSNKVKVNEVAKNVRPLFRKLRTDIAAIPAGTRSW